MSKLHTNIAYSKQYRAQYFCLEILSILGKKENNIGNSLLLNTRSNIGTNLAI